MRLISSFLFIIFFTFGLPVQMSARNLSTSQKDKLLVPHKITVSADDSRSEISLEYDDLLRITRVTQIITYIGTQIKEIKIFYDDDSPLNKPDSFYMISATEAINTRADFGETKPKYTYYKTKKISSDRIAIEENSDFSKEQYIVDASLGNTLENRVYNKYEDQDSLSYLIKIGYDSNQNIAEYSVTDFSKDASYEISNCVYDNSKTPFCNVKTPKWFLPSVLFDILKFNEVNNVTSLDLISKDERLKAKFDIKYNEMGYPIKYNSWLEDDSEGLDNFNFTIEYVSVHP